MKTLTHAVGLFLLGGLALGCAGTPQPEYEIVIRHGLVVDGTGARAFDADVAIQDGRVAAIGQLDDARGLTEIDATRPGRRAGLHRCSHARG